MLFVSKKYENRRKTRSKLLVSRHARQILDWIKFIEHRDQEKLLINTGCNAFKTHYERFFWRLRKQGRFGVKVRSNIWQLSEISVLTTQTSKKSKILPQIWFRMGWTIWIVITWPEWNTILKSPLIRPLITIWMLNILKFIVSAISFVYSLQLWNCRPFSNKCYSRHSNWNMLNVNRKTLMNRTIQNTHFVSLSKQVTEKVCVSKIVKRGCLPFEPEYLRDLYRKT